MDISDKIEILGRSAQYDICASDSCMGKPGTGRRRNPVNPSGWLYPAVTPDGKTVMLMKTLMTNRCRNNCAYCANRCDRSRRSTGFTPEELARTFLDLNRRGLAQGLFLSSAVDDNANLTMERMIKAVEMIRLKHHFHGYIHLKVLPGATYDLVARAVELATRVSINLEAPNPKRLSAIAEEKNFEYNLARMRMVAEQLRRPDVVCRGQTTQFIVGAAGESDREIVSTVSGLYRDLRLTRAYFSAFQPVPDTPLEDAPPAPLMREHRLYQTDFLFRSYGWNAHDIIFGPDGNLSLEQDPKLMWALAHPERFPIELNRAELPELLRVPGIGPRSAKRILRARRQSRFRSLDDLRAMGAVTSRAAQYVLLNGRRPEQTQEQLAFEFA